MRFRNPPPQLAAIRDRLGTAPDRVLGHEVGLSADVVRLWRRAEGKPAWKYMQGRPTPQEPPEPDVEAWIGAAQRVPALTAAERGDLEHLFGLDLLPAGRAEAGGPARAAAAEPALTLDGERHDLPTWAKLYGHQVATLAGRLRRGWTLRQALFTPPGRG